MTGLFIRGESRVESWPPREEMRLPTFTRDPDKGSRSGLTWRSTKTVGKYVIHRPGCSWKGFEDEVKEVASHLRHLGLSTIQAAITVPTSSIRRMC